MARTAKRPLTFDERVNIATERLDRITGGNTARLAQLRDSEKNSDIEQRCELAYYVNLKEWGGRRPIEVCIADRPSDSGRRVFGKVTHVKDEDGTVLDIYTKVRTAQPWAIPFMENCDD